MKKQKLVFKSALFFLLTCLLLTCFSCTNALFPKNMMRESLTRLQAYSQERSELVAVYVPFLCECIGTWPSYAYDSCIVPLDRTRVKALLATIQGKYIISEDIKNFDQKQGDVSIAISKALNQFSGPFLKEYYPRMYEFEKHFQALNGKIQTEKQIYNHFAEKSNRKEGDHSYYLLTRI